MKGILCEKARGFPIIKLFVLSTNMSNLYKRYFKKSEVVLRGAKAQHTVKKKEEGPNWEKYEQNVSSQSSNI